MNDSQGAGRRPFDRADPSPEHFPHERHQAAVATTSAKYQRALQAAVYKAAPSHRTYTDLNHPVGWCVFAGRSPIPRQGWKLHVSATAAEAVDLVERVVPPLLSVGATFKLPADLEGLVKINAGITGTTQIGKIVTVYPASTAMLQELVRVLQPIWRSSRGPAVPSDLQVAGGGNLYLRYGAFTSVDPIEDAVGNRHPSIEGPGRSRHPDHRREDGGQPSWAPAPPVPVLTRTDRLNQSAPVRIGDQTFVPLKLLAGRAKGRVVLGMRISDRALVVLRTASRGVESDEQGRDAVSRLKQEHDVLNALRGSGLAPEVVAFDPSAACLVVTDCGGEPLAHRPVDDQLAGFPDLLAKVNRLHRRGFVHRDLTVANLRYSSGQICLVDFELAAPIEATDTTPAGTDGYVPPEGRYASAQTSYDVYGLGSCLFEIVLRYNPGNLPRAANAGRQLGLLQMRRQHTAASIVQISHRRAEDRPTLDQLEEMVGEKLPALRDEARSKEVAPLLTRDNRRWAMVAAMDAGITTRRFLNPMRIGHNWRTAESLSRYPGEGINFGASGMILGLLTLDTALRTAQFDTDIAAGADWLAAQPVSSAAHGLFTGNSGVALALSLAGTRFGRADHLSAARRRLRAAAADRAPEYDLFSGAAGIVWSACLTSASDDDGWALDMVAATAGRLRDAAAVVDDLVTWPPTSTAGTDAPAYLGAAHGTAGIALALAVWGRSTGCRTSLELAELAFRGVLRAGLTEDSRNIYATTSGIEKAAHHWCHGIAGYLWCLLQAFPPAAYPELSSLHDQAVSMFISSTPLLDNLTMCHGLSGVLEMWRMVSALPHYRQLAERRAAELIQIFRLLHQVEEGSTTWTMGGRSDPAPDLWLGLLGPASQVALTAVRAREAILSQRWLAAMAGHEQNPESRTHQARPASYSAGTVSSATAPETCGPTT